MDETARAEMEALDFPPHPFGKFFALGDDKPLRHPEVWTREPTGGPDRLRIGGGRYPVRLLLALAEALTEPLYVLAVILVPRGVMVYGGEYEGNKYESEAMTHAEVVTFFDEFGEFFSNDGRAQAWVGSTQDDGLIVYDEHDLLYAYGPLEEFERILRGRSFAAGLAEIPAPHVHNYNDEFDAVEIRLREWSNWRRVLPPDEDD